VKRWFGAVVMAGAVPALLGACARQADSTALLGSSGDQPPSAPQSADDPNATVQNALTDVTTYWRSEFPQLYGGQFRDLKGFYPYGPNTAPPPCGQPPPKYTDIKDNAFYCPPADIIAWDASSLIPRINRTYGAFTVAIVMAHEYGHAIQARAGAEDRSIDLELQADCFAGAWTGQVATGHAAHFKPKDIDLDKAVAGMIDVRDPVGVSPDQPGAHGSGFDRVGAFQDGYEGDAAKCKPYANPDVDRTTAETPFSQGDVASGGNLHLEDRGANDPGLLSLATKDLNEFYGWLFGQLGKTWKPIDKLTLVDPAKDEATCDGKKLSGGDLSRVARFCQDEDTVLLDGTGLVHDLDSIGDFAVASEMAQLWALSAQKQLDTLSADKSDLQADCLTGVWAASTFPGVQDVTPNSDLGISPGDLDEAIMGFLYYGSALGRAKRTAFERIAALRTGVFGGSNGCAAYGPLAG